MKKIVLSLKQRKLIIMIAVPLLLIGGYYLFNALTAKGAVYAWQQITWVGGIDTGSNANHNDNQTGWTKFFSKDSNVVTNVGGEVTLTSTTTAWTGTEADLQAATKSNTYVSSGTVAMLKPLGVACASSNECASSWCRNGATCESCEPFNYGSQTYGVMVVGTECWMNGNLNIGTVTNSNNTGGSHSDSSNDGTIQKYCYNNQPGDCSTYGGLYDWNEAMGYVTTAAAQGICPSSWHIPTDAEWSYFESHLATSTCSSSRNGTAECAPAGTSLKQQGLPGMRLNTGLFNNVNSNGYFWTSSENGGNAWVRATALDSQVIRGDAEKNFGYSVRCIKD